MNVWSLPLHVIPLRTFCRRFLELASSVSSPFPLSLHFTSNLNFLSKFCNGLRCNAQNRNKETDETDWKENLCWVSDEIQFILPSSLLNLTDNKTSLVWFYHDGFSTRRPYRALLSLNWTIRWVSLLSKKVPMLKPSMGTATHKYWRVIPNSAIVTLWVLRMWSLDGISCSLACASNQRRLSWLWERERW